MARVHDGFPKVRYSTLYPFTLAPPSREGGDHVRVSESLVTWVVWRLRGGEGGSVGVVNGRSYEEKFFMKGGGG